jgi:rhodanese-related sulfurtransferase
MVQFRTRSSNPNAPGVEDIEPQEAWENKSEVLIVDVRRPDEFTGELGHIPGAQLMVLDTLPQRIEELPKDKTLVFVCLSGGRSSRACAFAKENGYDQVYNLKGGMTLWNQLNLQVEGRSKS